MKIKDASYAGPEMLKRNTRIDNGSFYAEIFIEDSVSGPAYHWTVWGVADSALIVLGEQSTYEIARQEAQHHLMLLVAEADRSRDLNNRSHAVGA